MTALFRAVTIVTQPLLYPTVSLDKSGVVNVLALTNLMIPNPLPGTIDKPETLADSAYKALTIDYDNSTVDFYRPWTIDEWNLVCVLLIFSAQNSSKSIRSLLKEIAPKKKRGRPLEDNKPITLDSRWYRGWHIDSLITGDVSQADARRIGAEKYSVSLRAAEKYHQEFLESQERSSSPEQLQAHKNDFNRKYLRMHWKNRNRFRSEGENLKLSAETMQEHGSQLRIKLRLFDLNEICLTIPPNCSECRAKLFSNTNSIHAALLLCIDTECKKQVTKRDLILRWPETTVIGRILDEAEKLAEASSLYSAFSYEN